jgi:putative copper export protein
MVAAGKGVGMAPEPHGEDDTLVRSYLAVRKSIGIVGMALPFVLVLGGLAAGIRLQGSLSAYYHTGVGDIFVGSLCAIAVFLWSYRGYDDRDDRAGNIACVAALGVALAPTMPAAAADPTALQTTAATIHVVSAAIFFASLAYFSLRLFPLSTKLVPTERKLARNRVYRVCGWTILGSMAAIGVVSVEPARSAAAGLRPVLWLEALAVLAFGVSWFTKGEAILGDRQGDVASAPSLARPVHPDQ